eukprot:COSAG05_NODE_4324_length_1567_cov_1.715259_1_plen_71_part_10
MDNIRICSSIVIPGYVCSMCDTPAIMAAMISFTLHPNARPLTLHPRQRCVGVLRRAVRMGCAWVTLRWPLT